MKPPLKPSERLAQILASQCPDEQVGEVLRDCLTATAVTRSGAVEPDTRTRLEAAKLVLAYRHGLPVRREESISVSIDAESTLRLAERLRASPALRQSLRAALSDAESGTLDV